MLMFRKTALAALACLTFAFTSCATVTRPALEMSGNQSDHHNQEVRLVIKTASSSIVVSKIEPAIRSVEALLKQEKGFVNNSSLKGEEEAFLELQVPEARLENVLDQLAALGHEENRHVASQDVTDQVRDKETILKNKQALRERLRDLLTKAKTVQEVIAVEEQLNRLQSEIEIIEGQLKKSKNDIEYSTIQLRLVRTTIYGPLGYVGYGLCWIIGKMFVIQ